MTPADYKCSCCGASGCKLWRQYQTFADSIRLMCCECAGKDQGEDISDIDANGMYPHSLLDGQRCDQIGSMVPAVPVWEEDTYWGYTSVPPDGVAWWRYLPTRPERRP